MIQLTEDQLEIRNLFAEHCENLRGLLEKSDFNNIQLIKFMDAIEHLDSRFSKLYTAQSKFINEQASAVGEGS